MKFCSTAGTRKKSPRTPHHSSKKKSGLTSPPPPLLGRRMVVVADHPCNLPCSVFVLPQMDKLPFANPLRVFMPRVVEAVHPHLHRAIALHVIDLQRPRNQFPRHFVADILLDAIGQFLPAERHAALIMIELHVVYEECRELFQVAPVIGIEQRHIQRCDGLIQLRLRLNVFQGRHRLSLCLAGKQVRQRQQQQHFGQTRKHSHREVLSSYAVVSAWRDYATTTDNVPRILSAAFRSGRTSVRRILPITAVLRPRSFPPQRLPPPTKYNRERRSAWSSAHGAVPKGED